MEVRRSSGWWTTLCRLRRERVYYKDCKGTLIEEGDKVRYRKKKGIVIDNDIEGHDGLCVKLKNGLKVRVKDEYKAMQVVYKPRKKHHNVGKRMWCT